MICSFRPFSLLRLATDAFALAVAALPFGSAMAQELLGNPRFESPAETTNGNHFHSAVASRSVNNLTVAQSTPFNIIKPDATYSSGPTATPAGGGVQYLELLNTAGYLVQNITVPVDGMISIGGFANFDLASAYFYQPITVTGTTVPCSDPVNGSTNPKFIPVGKAARTIAISTPGTYSLTSDLVVVSDKVPPNAALVVSDFGSAGSGPASFGAGSSGLTYSFASLSSPSDGIDFSNDNSATWTDTPIAKQRLDVCFDPAAVQGQRRCLDRSVLAAKNDAWLGVLQLPVADFADRDGGTGLGAHLGWVTTASDFAQSDPCLRTCLLDCQDAEAAKDNPAAAAFDVPILENKGLQARWDGTDPEAAEFVIPQE